MSLRQAFIYTHGENFTPEALEFIFGKVMQGITENESGDLGISEENLTKMFDRDFMKDQWVEDSSYRIGQRLDMIRYNEFVEKLCVRLATHVSQDNPEEIQKPEDVYHNLFKEVFSWNAGARFERLIEKVGHDRYIAYKTRHEMFFRF